MTGMSGGGERVLWTAIASMQRTEPGVISVVYSGDVDASKEEIIQKVKVSICTLFTLPLLDTLLCSLGLISNYPLIPSTSSGYGSGILWKTQRGRASLCWDRAWGRWCSLGRP